MHCLKTVARCVALICLMAWLVGGFATSTTAQDGGEQDESAGEVIAADGTPDTTVDETGALEEPLFGTVAIFVYTCAGPADSGAIVTDGSPLDQSCEEQAGAPVSLAFGGGAAQEYLSGDQVPLAEGTQDIVESSLGLIGQVVVAADASSQVDVLFYVETVEETPEPETGTVRVVKHLCPESIETLDDFYAIGDVPAQNETCPVITRPGDAGPDGAINGNDPGNPIDFDFTITYGPGDTLANQSISGGDAAFNPAELCENDLGQDLTGDGDQSDCLDTSDYPFAEVTQGPVLLTETIQAGYQLGAVQFDPGSDESLNLASPLVDTVAGTIGLETAGDDDVLVHVYNFETPAQNRLNITKHICPESVTGLDAFDALGDFNAKIASCPTITLPGDEGPAGSIGGGQFGFDFAVKGANGVAQTIDSATFVAAELCESDAGQDLTGNGDTSDCLDASHYQYDDVIQGAGVIVREQVSPEGFAFGAAELAPRDLAAVPEPSVDTTKGRVVLDTTYDGNVTLHVFNFFFIPPPDPTPTPTPTRTPVPTPRPTQPASQTGTVLVIKLWCLGGAYTVATALPPGQEASAGDLGDATCISGDAELQTYLWGYDPLDPFFIGDDGVEVLYNVPVTNAGTGQHTLVEYSSGYDVQVTFDVAPDTITRVIFLNYEEDELIEESGEEVVDDGGVLGEAVSEDASGVTTGGDLPETGAGAPMPLNGDSVLLLGAGGLLLLAGGSVLRRRRAF